MNTHITEVSPSVIRETFSSLRISQPRSQAVMTGSLVTHGQISPLVCSRRSGSVELIDGFKRLRSSRILQWPVVQVRFVHPGCCGKAELIRLNRISRSITPVEEALVVHSLHRSDRMSLEEIALLIGHDRRWVTRRNDLAEGLHEDVRQNLLSGTIGAGIAWMLAQLPTDIQAQCLARVLKYRLGERDIGHILRRSHGNAPDPLAWPWRILECDALPAPSRRAWYRRVADLQHRQQKVLAGATEDLFPECERDGLLLRETLDAGARIASFLDAQRRDPVLF